MSFRRYKLILMLLFALLVSAGRAAALSLEPIEPDPVWSISTHNYWIGLEGLGPTHTLVAYGPDAIMVPLPYYVVAILIVVAVALAVIGVFWLLSWRRPKR